MDDGVDPGERGVERRSVADVPSTSSASTPARYDASPVE